jgi:hypothetical protein
MNGILVATGFGCRLFTSTGEGPPELAGRFVSALVREPGGACLAVVDKQEIWRRNATGAWSRVATAGIWLQSIVSAGGTVFGGAMEEAAMLRVLPSGEAERLKSFDHVAGRAQWFAGGPPLGVRALTATADSLVILAAVHVGGIPRSTDGGETWTPTIPIMFDVHEVCSLPALPNIVAAAAAVGLCVSRDRGENWKVLSEGLELTNSLAAAALPGEVLFSIQDGPFAKRSQVWRWRIGSEHLEQVRDGLPQWLEGKIDTAHIAAGDREAAVVDGGGNLWVSREGSSGWERVADDLPYAFGLLVL